MAITSGRSARSQRMSIALSTLLTVILVGSMTIGTAHEAEAWAQPGGPIWRQEVLGRAQDWVNRNVAYSQSRWTDDYRQDCSGFISMAWKLADRNGRPMSRTTFTLDDSGFATPISIWDLKPGDILIKNTGSAHAVLFGGWWHNGQMFIYSESSVAGKATLRLYSAMELHTGWLSANQGYVAYRYNLIVDRV